MTEENSGTSSIIEEYVELIGDEVVLNFNDDFGGERDLEIFVCLHGNHRYDIIESPEGPYYVIRYNFDLYERIASNLNPNQVEDITGKTPILDPGFVETITGEDPSELEGELHIATEEVLSEGLEDDDRDFIAGVVSSSEDVDHDPKISAAKKLVESIDPEVRNRFTFDLFQELSNPNISTNIIEPGGIFRGFRIERKIFPGDSGFSLTEFNNSVQSVISIGTFGSNTVGSLVNSEINISAEGGEPEE